MIQSKKKIYVPLTDEFYVLDKFRLKRTLSRLFEETSSGIRDAESILSNLRPLEVRVINYINSRIRSLEESSRSIYRKGEECPTAECLRRVVEELSRLRDEVFKLRSEMHYLASVIPEPMLEQVPMLLMNFCSGSLKLPAIIKSNAYLSSLILLGYCNDGVREVDDKLAVLEKRLERVMSGDVHPFVRDFWLSFLEDEPNDVLALKNKLKDLKGLISEKTEALSGVLVYEGGEENFLKEMCNSLGQIELLKRSVDAMADRVKRYDEFREKYLSAQSFRELIPREALTMFKSPEEIHGRFSEEMRNEARSLAYLRGKEERADFLLKGIAEGLFRLQEV